MKPSPFLVSALIASLLASAASEGSAVPENCDRSQCDTGGIVSFYSELNCRPVYQDGVCCPARYDCSSFSARNANKCHYRGTEYDIGERVPTNKTSQNCLASCVCIGGDERPVDFICAQIECAELFGVPLPHPSCIRQYSLKDCCSSSTYCPNNKTEGEKEIATCEFEGQTYIKGQRFYPKDGCKTCICDETFDGTTDGPSCYDITCSIELRSGHYLRQGCAPVFYKNHCCPVQWQCPSENDRVIEGPNHKTNRNANDDDLTCTFGNLKFDFQDKLQPGEPSKVHCACITPPYLSCALKTDD
ncbi:kielin/chordin-like protein isoform X2 [Ischnura elegans]|uniref:kielin/chordin-like protein isoform X2 n=1 Tax=Ischnura elegans TaxID=197161 RepID=UPI001ED86FA7|nr:kielin/chordin-like protein isoform X2 [Ischnura elegans]